jgi:hypothetical protein
MPMLKLMLLEEGDDVLSLFFFFLSFTRPCGAKNGLEVSLVRLSFWFGHGDGVAGYQSWLLGES